MGRLAVAVVLSLLFAGAATGASAPRLGGTWVDTAGDPFVLTQSGSSLGWSAHSLDGTTWAHDFTGRIENGTYAGTYQDRPGYSRYFHGTISGRIIDNCHLTVVLHVVENNDTLTGGLVREPCRPADLLVPIGDVSNGCGGAGWDSVVRAQNYLGNTSRYANSNVNPTAASYTVNFKSACDLHDACYGGAVVRDELHGGKVTDLRAASRELCDAKFLADMQLLCRQQIPASAKTALANCESTGGNASVGARSRFDFVRCWGNLFYDLTVNGIPTAGRTNDKVSSLSGYCRFAK